MRRRVANNFKSRGEFWRHWCGYAEPFKIDQHLQEQKLSWDWVCFLITGFIEAVRYVSYGFERDTKVSIALKSVSDINETISMA